MAWQCSRCGRALAGKAFGCDCGGAAREVIEREAWLRIEAEARARAEAEAKARAAEPAWKRGWMRRCGQDGQGSWALTRIGEEEVRFRWCPPGSFPRGSPSDEEGRYDDERQHEVELRKGFWLAEHPVTQALWESVMGSNPSYFEGGSLPVEQVSWRDVKRFLSQANGASPGLRVRLPTEAEWEYACRAGTTGARYGSLDAVAWYDDNSGGKPQPVGGKAPNAWGLYDMLGNVLEWCSDWSADYPPGAAVDPKGPASGSQRVLRGGSWFTPARCARAAYRDALVPGSQRDCLGFRLARSE